MHPNLQLEWLSVVARLHGDRDAGRQAYVDVIAARYTEPHRHYHTLSHIARCLTVLRETCTPKPMHEDYSTVELALWLHDVVYDPRGKDNEERSAEILLDIGKRCHMDSVSVERAAAMIPWTKHDGRPPPDPQTQWLLDIDLSSLGMPPQIFDADSAAIRQEYGFVPDDAFHAGRKKLLQAFLDRPRIYYTEPCHHLFESMARINLHRAVDA